VGLGSAVVFRVPARIVPALVTAVAAVALWTALALAVPAVAAGNAVAVVVVVLAGLVVAARRAVGRRLPLVLIASAGSALLIFAVIAWLLPAVPGFVSDNHPPIYTPVTRLVDPIGELALAVLLATAFGLDRLRTRARTRSARSDYGEGPNQMVVERDE